MPLPHPMRTVPRRRSHLHCAPVAPALRSHGPRPTLRALRRLDRGATLFGVVCTIALGAALPADAAPLTYQMVTVGDPGNAPNATGYGAVGYEYRIGTYEVTIGQYCAFLNAVAASDPYFAYDAAMATDATVAGIARSGSPGTFTYSVIGPAGTSYGQSAADRPVAYVTWFRAARFANWMANGQPTGPQGPSTTETGAYALNGAFTGPAVARTPGAAFAIPTEDEWVKAAYYSPTKGASGGYWAYATQSDADPANTLGGGTNAANCYGSAGFSLTQSHTYDSTGQNYLTTVGAFVASASFYGTFDQLGNLSEWNDLDGSPGTTRGIRGANWSSYPVDGDALIRSTQDPQFGYRQNGFRLMSPGGVPEIDPAGLGSALALLGGVLSLRERLRHRCRTRPDGTAAIATRLCPAVHPHAR